MQRDMPQNPEEEQPGVNLSRTGPAYVRLEGIPVMAQSEPVDHRAIRHDMFRIAGAVLGFEDVHIYAPQLCPPHPPQMGYALFVFSTLACESSLSKHPQPLHLAAALSFEALLMSCFQ